MSEEQPEPAPDATAARADTTPDPDVDADTAPGREPDVSEAGRSSAGGTDPDTDTLDAGPEVGTGADREGTAGAEERAVDLLAWLFETETSARIYVHLRREPWSTSSEVAEGIDRYPSTVREALADLAADDVLERRKRAAGGAGNNPYEYRAVPPGELLGALVGEFQHELNALCRLGDDTPVAVAVERDGTDDEAAAGPERDPGGVEPPTEGEAGADPGAGSGNPKR